jgi:flavin reductase (DIM6/NTAB) family NADH-FMN oxidoreductase RutF
MTIHPGDFKRGMRYLAASVTLITTYHEGQRGGLTATAVCSVSADPPQLLACVNKTAGCHDAIGASGIFCVNVLAPQHEEIARRYAGMHGVEGDERFRLGGEWRRLTTGAPVLGGCPVSFDCKVVECMVAGTHTIYLGRIVDVAIDENATPLFYVDAKFIPGTNMFRPSI